jgi:hypothetical protein
MLSRSIRPIRQLASPFEAHRRITSPWRSWPHDIAPIDSMRRCVESLNAVVRCAVTHPEVLTNPEIAGLSAAVSTNVISLRVAITSQASLTYAELLEWPGGRLSSSDQSSSKAKAANELA